MLRDLGKTFMQSLYETKREFSKFTRRSKSPQIYLIYCAKNEMFSKRLVWNYIDTTTSYIKSTQTLKVRTVLFQGKYVESILKATVIYHQQMWPQWYFAENAFQICSDATFYRLRFSYCYQPGEQIAMQRLLLLTPFPIMITPN